MKKWVIALLILISLNCFARYSSYSSRSYTSYRPSYSSYSTRTIYRPTISVAYRSSYYMPYYYHPYYWMMYNSSPRSGCSNPVMGATGVVRCNSYRGTECNIWHMFSSNQNIPYQAYLNLVMPARTMISFCYDSYYDESYIYYK